MYVSLTFFRWFYLNHFFEKTRPGWKVTISTNRGDWYPAVAARSRRCLVSTSIAKQPEREIRPAISVSLFLYPFSAFSPCPRLLSLSLPLSRPLFNFHWKPRTTGIIRTKEILNVILVESRIFRGQIFRPFCTFKCWPYFD